MGRDPSVRGWQGARFGGLERASGTRTTSNHSTFGEGLSRTSSSDLSATCGGQRSEAGRECLRDVRRRRQSTALPDPYIVVLAVLFALEWLVLAIWPRSREDWILENALSVAFVVALALSHRCLVFSGISYTTIFLFLSVHTIGAYYT